MTSRWIRLDTTWSYSKWMADLHFGSRLAWVELLCYTKSHGVGGRVKALPVPVAETMWRIYNDDSPLVGAPTDYREPNLIPDMLSAAIEDGALQIDGPYWIVSNWAKYQRDVSTDRVREHRERKETHETVSNEVERKETATETETGTETGTKNTHTAVVLKDGNFVADCVDQVLAHTETQATKAEYRAELARVVFMYWAARTQANPKRTKWDDKRRTRLVARLKENQDDIAELLCVVDGALNDDFHKGDNDRGRPFLQIQTIFRDREMVEKLATLSPHYGKDIHPFMAPP